MRRRTKPQAAPSESVVTLPMTGPRRGLVVRWRERVIVRRLAAALGTPAAAPLVAVVVAGVFVAIALGVVLGLALAAVSGDTAEW